MTLREQRLRLETQISEWNSSRFDLFEIHLCEDGLQFYGVMRFYYQDDRNSSEVNTKCIRVSSTATTLDVISTLVNKFGCDMRMLGESITDYALYVVHANGEERRLNPNECPLYVQLNWTKDVRDGRFLLRKLNNSTLNSSLRKKKNKKIKGKEQDTELPLSTKLYQEKPESYFTRSISNPKSVMQKKREQKLEAKMNEFENKDGGPSMGGALKVGGGLLSKDLSYKTILVSSTDTSSNVVALSLQKFDFLDADPDRYIILQVILPHGYQETDYRPGLWKERFLEDEEFPWQNFSSFPAKQGKLIFLLSHRPPELMKHKARQGLSNPQQHNATLPRKQPQYSHQQQPQHSLPRQPQLSRMGPTHQSNPNLVENRPPPNPRNRPMSQHELIDDIRGRLPYLIEIPADRSQSTLLKHDFFADVTDVGTDPKFNSGGQFLQIMGAGVLPHHCTFAQIPNTGMTLAPASPRAVVSVNNYKINGPVVVDPGALISIGDNYVFRFMDPNAPPPENLGHPRKDESAEEDLLETTFDVDGNIETRVSTENLDCPDGSFTNVNDQTNINDDYLPAAIDYELRNEPSILSMGLENVDEVTLLFKIAPSYLVYMCSRYLICSKHNVPLSERIKRVNRMCFVAIDIIDRHLQNKSQQGCAVAVWLANVCEIHHFLSADGVLRNSTVEAQSRLTQMMMAAAHAYEICVQRELTAVINAFFDTNRADLNIAPGLDAKLDAGNDLNRWITPNIVGSEGRNPQMHDVISILASASVLLRKCRVNPVLNKQILANIFIFLNSHIFNIIVTNPEYLCGEWGKIITTRLVRVDAWVERSNVQLPQEAKFVSLRQLLRILLSPKQTSQDADRCIEGPLVLNPLQVKTVVKKYRPERMEPQITDQFYSTLMRRAEGQIVNRNQPSLLEEDSNRRIPFYLPNDDFSTNRIVGVPEVLEQYLAPIVSTGLCYIGALQDKKGRWDVYLHKSPSPASNQLVDQQLQKKKPDVVTQPPLTQQSASLADLTQKPPQIREHSPQLASNKPLPSRMTVRLQKKNNSLGLSIVSAKGINPALGIFVKALVQGGAAEMDGRLQAGDQLIKVDGQNLVGIVQEEAARLLMRTDNVVTLEVEKQAAIPAGLGHLYNSKPSQQKASVPTSEANSLYRPQSTGVLNAEEKKPHNVLTSQTNRNMARSSPNLTEPRNEDASIKSKQRLGHALPGLTSVDNRNTFQPIQHNKAQSDVVESEMPAHPSSLRSTSSQPILDQKSIIQPGLRGQPRIADGEKPVSVSNGPNKAVLMNVPQQPQNHFPHHPHDEAEFPSQKSGSVPNRDFNHSYPADSHELNRHFVLPPRHDKQNTNAMESRSDPYNSHSKNTPVNRIQEPYVKQVPAAHTYAHEPTMTSHAGSNYLNKPPVNRDFNRSPTVHPSGRINNNVNPWLQESRENQERLMEDEKRNRKIQLLRDLETKSQLSPDEEEKLRNLRLDIEFEKRVDEERNNSKDKSRSVETDLDAAEAKFMDAEIDKINSTISSYEENPPSPSNKSNIDKEQLEFLEAQRLRHQKQKREQEEYLRMKQEQEDLEQQRRVEEMRWRKEMEKVEMRKIQDREKSRDRQRALQNVEDEPPERPPLPIMFDEARNDKRVTFDDNIRTHDRSVSASDDEAFLKSKPEAISQPTSNINSAPQPYKPLNSTVEPVKNTLSKGPPPPLKPKPKLPASIKAEYESSQERLGDPRSRHFDVYGDQEPPNGISFLSQMELLSQENY